MSRLIRSKVNVAGMTVAGSMALLSSLSACTGAQLADSGNRVNISTALDFNLPVRSLADRRFLTVVHQQYDFSCGSAALATLLSFHYRGEQNEQSVFLGMWQHGDQEKIRRQGFSLLDMKRYLAGRGIGADGYKVTLPQIVKAKIPGIVLINYRGYKHFIVVKGFESDKLLVGDPALGLRLIDAGEFQKSWNGVFFVIRNQRERGGFNQSADWQLAPRARFMQEPPMSLQALALTRPLPGEL